MSKKEETENLDEELKKALEQAEMNLKGWQRAVADFDNYKKRDEKHHAELMTYGQEQVIQVFLSLFEDLDRLLTYTPKSQEELDNWIKGVEGVRGRIDAAFKEIGIEKIKTVGEKFNPDLHDAVEQVEGEENGVIAEEVAAGYKRGERVLKTAQVKVYKKIDSYSNED